MNEKYVLDASIVIKWYIDEIYSEDALKIRDQYVQAHVTLEIPELLFYEVLNGLRYSNLFTLNEVNEVNKSLVEYEFKTHFWNIELGEKAINYAFLTKTTIYDCVYLALADKLECTLITADQKFITKLMDIELLPHVVHIANISSR